MKMIFGILCLIPVLIQAETFKLDFKLECLPFPKEPYSYFYVMTHLKIKGSKSAKIYQIQCRKNTMKCSGVDLSVSDDKIGMMGLLPQEFKADSISISESTASFVYNNVNFNIDTKENSVKMIVFFKGTKTEKATEERWEGKCE